MMPSRSCSGVRLEVRRSPSDSRLGFSNGDRRADVGGQRTLNLGWICRDLATAPPDRRFARPR